MDEKVIFGLIGVLVGGLFTVIVTYMTANLKLKELQILQHNRLSERKLAAANEKMKEVYIPILSKLETMNRGWSQYLESKTDEDKEKFLEVFKEFKSQYMQLLNEGMSVYLLLQVQDEIEFLVRLVEKSKDAKMPKWTVRHRYEAIGLVETHEEILPLQAAITKYVTSNLRQLIYKSLLFLRRPLGNMTITNITLRLHSAPINSENFASEFKLCMDLLRSSSKEVALYKDIKTQSKGDEK
jgi:hypothetical protein